MERRRFIYCTAAGLAGAFAGCQYRNKTGADRLAHPDFLSHICDAATLRAIGAAYRKKNPSESQSRQLTPLLENNTDPRSIRQEFAAGNIVIVKGWVLSLTEARQCALYSVESD